jgi:hypothetical protein
VDDHIISGNPVDGGGDAVLVTGLQGVDHAEHLSGVAASGGGVGEDETDGLLGVNDEDGADGKRNALGVDIGGVLVVQPAQLGQLWRSGNSCGDEGWNSHVIEVRDLALLVANDREVQVAAGDLIDILDPSSMRLDGVGGQTDQLGVALGELGLQLGEGAQLGGADGRVVLRVGEEDNPVVANELMEVNGALGGVGLKVGGSGTQAEADRDVVSNLGNLQRGEKVVQRGSENGERR